jgi:hypothetical protein
MKKILVAFALAAVASTASASIAAGSHDLRTAPYNGTLPACQYCHAPHLWVTANESGGPLWNRNITAAGAYTAYTSTGFTSTVTLGVASRVCLSCHDGSALLNSVNNGSGTMAVTTIGAFGVGTDLRDDHPVGVVYTTGTYYADISANSNVTLYSAQVECATCHDPHGTSDGAAGGTVFARWGTGVDLCAQCHLK